MAPVGTAEPRSIEVAVIDRVIVPLDGSVRSESALPHGLAMARRFDAGMKVVMTTFSADSDEEERYIEGQAERLGYERASAELRRDRFPTRGIVNACAGNERLLICMATSGRLRTGREAFGGVAQGVVSATGTPTVLVGPSCLPVPALDGPMIACWDGSHASASMIRVAARWAKALGVELRLVIVDDSGSADSRMSNRLAPERLAEQLGAEGVVAHTDLLEHPDPARGIADHAASLSASFIAVSMRDRSGPGLGVNSFGSVAAGIIDSSPSPVLVRCPSDAPPR